ncbi:TPR repeat-containing protein [Desulfatibacillum aliphaticivorans]|uniref:TPR repeat-containing protein n=1 Tax=Desulfatibacillum aliphaticivorans TaxID=218208 RepID=B8FFN4_DESAL|nr:tetratricopeptide repeat protein [Desulfatibacillum aliphaticivorans]ACL03439.1 TPR repeat-containing protein [Desulfatibacillum aliphaticivorans]
MSAPDHSDNPRDIFCNFIKINSPVLWVGAGLSIDAGYPTITRLAQGVREHALDDSLKSLNDYKLIDAFLEKSKAPDLDRILSGLISVGCKCTESHRAAARLAKAGFFKTVITTNYDRLLEDAFNQEGVDYLPQVLENNLRIPTDGKVRLIKIHGDVGDWKNVILSGASYETFAENFPLLTKQLDLLLSRENVLFAGCSMQDERILSWVEKLSEKEKGQVPQWIVPMTSGDRDKLESAKAPGGGSAADLLKSMKLDYLELPDYNALKTWLNAAADELPPEKPDRDLVVEIQAGEEWEISCGESGPFKATPLSKDEDFLAALEALEKIIHVPLPCDENGRMASELADKRAVIDDFAKKIGEGLAGLLGTKVREALEIKLKQRTPIPLLRLRVQGGQAHQVLALPWELLFVDGEFPVKEARLDIVRECVGESLPELPPASGDFKVMVHIASPEDVEGRGALGHEEESYRLVLSMEEAAGDAVFYLASCHGLTPDQCTPGKPGEAHRSRQLTEVEAVKGHSPSSASILHEEGCAAVLGYYGPVGDHLSTRAEAVFYGKIASGGLLTDAVRQARSAMQKVLGEPGDYVIHPLGWSQLALYLRGDDRPVANHIPGGKAMAALEMNLHRSARPVQELEEARIGANGFIARRKIMAKIRSRYQKGQRVLVLYGPGGIGKTALALNLIPRLTEKNAPVIMLDGSRAGKAEEQIKDLWDQLAQGLEKHFFAEFKALMEKHEDAADWAFLFLEATKAVTEEWLLYLDNAETLQVNPDKDKGAPGVWLSPDLDSWWNSLCQLAKQGCGFTLMATTRYAPHGLKGSALVSVDALRKADILRMMRWFPCLRCIPLKLREGLASWLAGHARALVYLEGQLERLLDDQSPEEVLPEDWPALLDKARPLTGGKLTEDLYLDFIWERLSAPQKEHLHGLTALRRPAPEDAIQCLGTEAKSLKRLGLLTAYGAGLLWLHPTAAGFVADKTGQANKEHHLAIGEWYLERFDENKEMTSAQEAFFHLAEAQEAENAAGPADWLGKAFKKCFRFSEARDVLSKAIVLMPDAKLLEGLLFTRGYLLDDMGCFMLSFQDFTDAEHSARSRQNGDESMATALHGKANALVKMSRYGEALEAYERSLEIKKWVHRTEVHPDYAASLHGKANALYYMGRYSEAVNLYDKRLEIEKKLHKTEVHPDYAASLHGKANALYSMGRNSEAVALYDKRLEIERKVHKTEVHPDYASSLHGKASSLFRMGQYQEAVEAYGKSLEIKKMVYGSDRHPSCLPTLASMGMCHARMGELESALKVLSRALVIAEEGDYLWEKGNILFLTAQVTAAFDKAAAKPLALEAWDILSQFYKPDHPLMQDIAEFIHSLG